MRPFYYHLLYVVISLVGCNEAGDKEFVVGERDRVESADISSEAEETSEKAVAANEVVDSKFVGMSRETVATLLEELLSSQYGSRYQLLKEFFEGLAGENPAMALELLPENLSLHEQREWAVAVAIGFIKDGDTEGAAGVLNSRFPSRVRTSAIEACVEAFDAETSPEEAIQFWSSLDPQGTTDGATGSLAAFLRSRDPMIAVEWYETLEAREARQNAVKFVVGEDRETIVKQYAVAEERRLRRSLASGFGRVLAAEGLDLAEALAEVETLPADLVEGARYTYSRGFGETLRYHVADLSEALEKLAQVPKDMISDAESSYVASIIYKQPPSPKIDYEALEDYASRGFTSEGRDAAQAYHALHIAPADPTKAVAMFEDTGLMERDPFNWGRVVIMWLQVDARAVSEYVVKMESGPGRDAAAEHIVTYLLEKGDQEGADAWKSEIGKED